MGSGALKRFWIQISVFGIALSILAAYYVHLRIQWIENEILYRAQIARMLALIKYEPDECAKLLEAYEKGSLPLDLSKESWYDKYAAVAIKEGWMNTSEELTFNPGDVFTYKDLKVIMDAFYISEESLSFSMKFREADGMVSRNQWYEVFRLIIVNEKEIQKNTYIIYDTSATSGELEPWQVLTDQGEKYTEGLAMDAFVGHRIDVYTKGEHILGIVEVLEEIDRNENKIKNENIRVLLHETEGDYEHEAIRLTSDEVFYVMNGESVWKYSPSMEIEFDKNDSIFENGEVRIKTDHSNGKIVLQSLERAYGTPSYDGEIILQKEEEGIIIINDIALEDYVAGVLPSEMPVSYGMEALKAQAVCIRTYAKRALASGFKNYPAHVDDTVSTQVYNNQVACEESIQAVVETEGIVLKNKNGYTPTYFFSTSCGHTSLAEDVWYDGREQEKGEDSGVFLTDENVELNLSDEEQFRAFISMENTTNYFEEELPWFRWQVFISDETIEENTKAKTETDIGNLIEVQILERASSGLIKSVLIRGDKDEAIVYGELCIREIFSPEGAELRNHTGTVITDWKRLPSGYFYMDALIELEECKGYLLHGGGYGHGCGLSQNGAMKMAETGMTYEEILKYFFADSEIIKE